MGSATLFGNTPGLKGLAIVEFISDVQAQVRAHHSASSERRETKTLVSWGSLAAAECRVREWDFEVPADDANVGHGLAVGSRLCHT